MANAGLRKMRFRKCGNSWTYGRIFGSVAAKGLRGKRTEERTALGLKEDTPVFFVSVASKRVSPAVSLLFATLAGRSISVAAEGVNPVMASGPDRVGAGQWAVVSEEKDGG